MMVCLTECARFWHGHSSARKNCQHSHAEGNDRCRFGDSRRVSFELLPPPERRRLRRAWMSALLTEPEELRSPIANRIASEIP